MRGIVIYCPGQDCRKPLLRDAYLRIGSRCSLRCFSCGGIILIESTEKGVNRMIKGGSLPDTVPDDTMKKDPGEDSCFIVVEN